MSGIVIAGFSAALTTWLTQRLQGIPTYVTHSGHETLQQLVQAECSLLLIDHSVIQPTAVEVVRTIRQGRERMAIPVIYCAEKTTGSVLQRELVNTLGVSRLMLHPLDRTELASQIATLVGQPLSHPVGKEAPVQQQTAAAMAELWERFKDTMTNRVIVLERAAMALLEGTLDDELRREAEREAHKLAGSVGTFGFMEGSRLAREMEHMLHAGVTLTQTHALQLSELVVALLKELERPLTPALPVAQVTDDPHPLLLIVDNDTILCERLTIEATGRGMRVEVAESLTAARQARTRARPHVVLLNLLLSGTSEDGLALLAELASQTPPIPVLVMTAHDTFIDRVEVARRGGRGFLRKLMSPVQLLDAATALLAQVQTTTANILAVDDDPQVLAVLRTILEPYSFRLTTLDDPLRFWDVLTETMPDLLMLDVEMPHLDGTELCRVVRNEQQWREVPVLFLTAHTDAATVQRLFTAGADDYVSKPIIGPELVARIHNRLERSSLLRSMAETDPLTGLANRRKSTQALGQFLRLASRQQQSVSLAVLDLDHFKYINDQHGHAVGDDVLHRLAERLLQSFRSEDVVARWGGEEFVVGMYGMPREGGVHRLAEVLEALRQEAFTSGNGARFHVTFSAGVAEYPTDGSDIQTLYRAADQALYQAKEAGCDRVVPAGWCPAQAQVTRSVDVMVVDNDETLASLLLHALETRGYRHAWLRDGEAAVSALAGPRPQLKARVVLLDVDLPGLDGLTVLRRLGRDGVLRGTRVIMLTFRSAESEVVEALELGAFDHVAKPFSLPVLMQRIRRTLQV
jgi:diguanylate cyclase (GGDEF)-like protein